MDKLSTTILFATALLALVLAMPVLVHAQAGDPFSFVSSFISSLAHGNVSGAGSEGAQGDLSAGGPTRLNSSAGASGEANKDDSANAQVTSVVEARQHAGNEVGAGQEGASQVNSSASAEVEAEIEISAHSAASEIATAAQNFSLCGHEQEQQRQVCLNQTRSELVAAIDAATRERIALEQKQLAALREREGSSEAAAGRAQEIEQQFVSAQAQFVSDSSALDQFRQTPLEQMDDQERSQYRAAVNATVMAHFQVLERLLDKLEADGISPSVIASERVQVSLDEQQWLNATTPGEKQSAYAASQAEWESFKQSISTQYVNLTLQSVVASSTQAVAQARIAIVGLASKGADISEADSQASEVQVEVGVLSSQGASLSLDDLSAKLQKLHDSFEQLKISINTVVNKAQVEANVQAGAQASAQVPEASLAAGEQVAAGVQAGSGTSTVAAGAGQGAQAGASGSLGVSAGAQGSVSGQSSGQASGSVSSSTTLGAGASGNGVGSSSGSAQTQLGVNLH